MKIDLKTVTGVLTVVGIVVVAMKFKGQILGLVSKVPVAGPIVANLAA